MGGRLPVARCVRRARTTDDRAGAVGEPPRANLHTTRRRAICGCGDKACGSAGALDPRNKSGDDGGGVDSGPRRPLCATVSDTRYRHCRTCSGNPVSLSGHDGARELDHGVEACRPASAGALGPRDILSLPACLELVEGKGRGWRRSGETGAPRIPNTNPKQIPLSARDGRDRNWTPRARAGCSPFTPVSCGCQEGA